MRKDKAGEIMSGWKEWIKVFVIEREKSNII